MAKTGMHENTPFKGVIGSVELTSVYRSPYYPSPVSTVQKSWPIAGKNVLREQQHYGDMTPGAFIWTFSRAMATKQAIRIPSLPAMFRVPQQSLTEELLELAGLTRNE